MKSEAPRGWRVWLAVCALAAAAGVLVVAQQPSSSSASQTPPVFREGVNFVLVDAYPRRAGHIVEGLTAADFQIFEDGKPQAVDRVEFVRIEPRATDAERRDPSTTGEMRGLTADPHRRVFVTFLDTLHTTVPESHTARKPLVDLLDRIVGPDDLFGVMTQDIRPQDLTLGRKLLTVDEQLSAHWIWGERQRIANTRNSLGEDALTACFHQQELKYGVVPWYVTVEGQSRFFDEVLIERRREDEVLNALQDLVAYLGSLREARTALVIVTDGWRLFPEDRSLLNTIPRDERMRQDGLPHPGDRPINGGGVDPLPPQGQLGVSSTEGVSFASCVAEATRLAGLDQPRRFRDLIAEANRRNVSAYPIAMNGLAVFDDASASLMNDMTHLTQRVSSLRTLAEGTGGLAIVNTNDIDGGVRRMADDLSAYYLIGYYSTNTKKDGRLRRIEVKTRQPDIEVHARSSYRAPDAGAAAAAASATAVNAALPVDEALGPLGRLRESTPIYVNGARADGEWRVAVELSDRQVATSGWSQGANVTVQIDDAKGRRVGEGHAAIDAGARGALVRVPVAAEIGPVRIAVRATTAEDAVSETIDVPLSSSVLLGDPLLFRATTSLRAPLRPAADRQFRRTERAHVEWPLLRALDQRTARLLDRRGQPLPMSVALTERPDGDRTMAAIDLAIAPLADGDYVIELVAASQGITERKLLGIRVVR
ncbi:MAG TPA: VWA domain-containing protein [Vicinamibacterales bacterium]|nr:VWA domain-containing protein [Vicinamibacterales bacterium]